MKWIVLKCVHTICVYIIKVRKIKNSRTIWMRNSCKCKFVLRLCEFLCWRTFFGLILWVFLLFYRPADPSKCPVCPYTNKNQNMMNRHMRRHTPCTECGKVFRSKANLNRHIATHHTKSETFQCDRCDKTFYRKDTLHRHQLQHDPKKCFKCDLCNVTFYLEFNFKRHKKSAKHAKALERFGRANT